MFWGFEDGTEGWTFVDADGDGYNWARYNDSDYAYEGDYSLRSYSWNGSVLTPDNWAISPAFSLSGASDATLSLYAYNRG